MKNIKTILLSAILVVLGVGIGVFYRTEIVNIVSPNSQPYGDSKFQWTLNLLDNKYVDKINMDSLLNEVVPQVISKLDPHSDYIDAKDLVAVNETIEGKFEGIGVVFNMATDTAIVLNVISGGPGAKAGVEPGDRIIEVNDTVVAGVKLDQMELVSKLRGKRGTEVDLSIQRGENKELLDFTLVRDIIPITSVEAEFLTPSNSAYIKINTFAENTYVDAINAIDGLVKEGATSIVMDLRGNGGGLLDQALLLANEFLSANQVIVFVKGEHFQRMEQRADGRGAFQNIPLFVLIDESSASASEIFAGAMQDNDRATIVGRRSFGKGLVQEQVQFADGSAARITVARYYTPIGRPLQKPYTAGDEESYQAELLERYENNEVTTGINAHVDSTKTYTTAGGRVLFGGGGITPDEFVGVDTTELPKYFLKLFQSNAMFPYGQKFADSHREKINHITDVKELDKFFEGYPNLYNDFVAYAKASHGVATPSAKEKAEARKIVESQLKAYIGRYTPLQESAFYYYIHALDNTMLRVDELLK